VFARSIDVVGAGRYESGAWEAPTGCKKAEIDGRIGRPYTVLEADGLVAEEERLPCHKNHHGVVSSGGGECLFVAEPMKCVSGRVLTCTASHLNPFCLDTMRMHCTLGTTCMHCTLDFAHACCTSHACLTLHAHCPLRLYEWCALLTRSLVFPS
jgi:hypothetical protein